MAQDGGTGGRMDEDGVTGGPTSEDASRVADKGAEKSDSQGNPVTTAGAFRDYNQSNLLQ